MAPNEVLINSYVCALVDNILLQGKLYLTSHKLCFHSYFNKSNIFFGVENIFDFKFNNTFLFFF